ncbi:MAG: PEP-CTERM sorting domain-containing protein, partial [Planctomycetota bacterium]
ASYQSGPGDVVLEVNPGNDNLLNFSLAAKTDGEAKLVWDGIDGSPALDYTGLGGFDLTNGGALDRITIPVAFDDLPVTLVMEVWTDSNYMSDAQLNLPGGIFSPVDYEILFTSFVSSGSSGPADFSNVGMIVLDINVQYPGTDLQIDYIKATPEPATLLLLILGCLPVLRRKR